MKNIILQANSLCKSFANEGNQNHVLDNLDIKIYEKDFTVIMGSSGSGKSTLLYSLSGMDRPTSGTVTYKDMEITSLSEKKLAKVRGEYFGFVFQQINLISNLTVLENVLVPGYRNKEKSAKEVKDRALMLLEKVNVEETKDRLPSQVSGGEAQRCAIARAIINEPGLLFADEPTGALNRRNTESVLDLLTEINKDGQSIIMVTHDIKAAIRGNRIIYLEDGKISGELELAPFDGNVKDREAQVNAWLTSMNW